MVQKEFLCKYNAGAAATRGKWEKERSMSEECKKKKEKIGKGAKERSDKDQG